MNAHMIQQLAIQPDAIIIAIQLPVIKLMLVGNSLDVPILAKPGNWSYTLNRKLRPRRFMQETLNTTTTRLWRVE